MKTAFLYAGQGSQKPGMGKSFYENCPTFKEVIDRAASFVSFDMKTIMFEGPEDVLTRTEYTQPCLAAFAAGVTAVLKEKGYEPCCAAGLSLGEYSALYAAGVFDLETLIRTTAYRGQVMAEAGRGLHTKMSAVLGLDEEWTAKACGEAAQQTGEPVWIANYNAAGQIVIAGLEAAVSRAEELAKEAGAKRCMPLKVSSAFHTPFMEPASEKLADWFRTISFGEEKVPVLYNALGRPKEESETTAELLRLQVMSPVHMTQILRFLEAGGVERVIEIGPGRTLAGFIKRTAPGIRTLSLDEAADLELLNTWG